MISNNFGRRKNDPAKDRKALETYVSLKEYKQGGNGSNQHVQKDHNGFFAKLTLDEIVKRIKSPKINLYEYIYKFVRIIYNNSTKGERKMSITATELKQNLGKYLLLSVHEDIYITKNGKTIAKLSNPNQNRVETARSLFGILPEDADIEESRMERLDSK